MQGNYRHYTMAMNGLPSPFVEPQDPQSEPQSASSRGASNYIGVKHSRVQEVGQRDQLTSSAHLRSSSSSCSSSSLGHKLSHNHRPQAVTRVDLCAATGEACHTQQQYSTKLTCNNNNSSQVHDKQFNLHQRVDAGSSQASSAASKPDQYASQLRKHNFYPPSTMQSSRQPTSSSQQAKVTQQPQQLAHSQQQQVRKSVNHQQQHVNFNRSNQKSCQDDQDEPGEGRKKKYLTAKYGQQQMNLIKKRLKIEMWLYEQLQELAKGTKSEVSLFVAKPELADLPLRSNDN